VTEALVYLAAAVVFVPLAARAKLGSVLGYLIAGAAIGPWGLALVGDVESTLQLAELGVVLMLFVIGLKNTYKINPTKSWISIAEVNNIPIVRSELLHSRLPNQPINPRTTAIIPTITTTHRTIL